MSRSFTFFRLSPASRATATVFAVARGALEGSRFDVNYWQLLPTVEARLGRATYTTKPLGELISLIQYGSSKLATTEPRGVRIVRMNNLQADGWDFSDLKYVELSAAELLTYRLKQGDLLFNRTNSKELVGKCEVFREPGNWVYASYLIRVRANPELLEPQFAADFLNGAMGRLQINQLSRQIIGMTNINAEEIRGIRIPTPSLDRQREVVAGMDAARAAKSAKWAQADRLLATFDDFLLARLQLPAPREDTRKVFATSIGAVRSGQRLNADYFHPERLSALRSMQSAARGLASARLSDVVEFVRDQIKCPSSNYIGLAHVKSQTGELIDADEDASGACSIFREDDVLFARLRPYLNKVYRAESDGCCSPEFHVMRSRNPGALLPDYLAALLRSRLILAQTCHMMTGNTHPRLTNDDVVNLIIPLPDPAVQAEIVRELRHRRDEAHRLRQEVRDEWAMAKNWFEAQLFTLD